MATLVLSAVGTAIGGPIGGSIGAIIGQQADLLIFGSGSREGPRLKELSVTTSSYGQPIPRHFGRMRVAGTVIWSTELVESSSKEGGGKGRPSTKTYSYSVSFAVALSSTPITGIGRIWADGNLLRGAEGDLKVAGAMRMYPGTGDNPVDPLIAADRGETAPAFRDCAHVVFEDLQLADFGNRIPALTFEVFAQEDARVSLGQLVPQSDQVSGEVLLENARGFSDEGGPVGSSLAAIDKVFPLSCVTTADGLKLAAERSLPAEVPMLPEQLSPLDSEDAEAREKERGRQRGREPLALRYYDEERDYQPGVQRALGRRPDGRESMVDLPAAMTATGARQLANSNANRARWQDEHIVWKTGELDPEIGPGSVVRIPETSGFWSVRSWEWFDRGVELGLDRLAPEVGAIAASDAGSANTPLDLLATPTLLDALEVPLDSASDPSNPAMFAAASSVGAGWRGASLYVEQGATLLEVGNTGTERAVIGSLAAQLGPSNCTTIEPTASLEVDLPADDIDFNSTDITGIAMGANRLMVGGEVIQFLDASPINPFRWKLSGLLRGRAGTEDAAIAGHDTDSPVVLLDDRLTALDPAQVPSSGASRIAAIGQGDEGAIYASLRNAGISRRPPMPVAPRVKTQLDGSLEACWTRRARGQWRWNDGGEVPIIEESESYAIGYGSVESPAAAWTTNEPVFSLEAAERADLIAQFGSASLWVQQVGTFGKSSPLLLATLT